jgi:hypothetical protein
VWPELEERRSRSRAGALANAADGWHPAPGDPEVVDQGAGL